MNNLFYVLNYQQRYNKNPNKNAITESVVFGEQFGRSNYVDFNMKKYKISATICYDDLIQTANGIS